MHSRNDNDQRKPESRSDNAGASSPNPWLAYATSEAGNGHHWPIAVTFFKDKFAKTKSCEQLTLPDLREQIARVTANTKASLPWLKLAVFGNQPNEENCLRYDANVIEITGAEGDYDGEQIAFDTAVATIERAGVRALLYTSPSHNPLKPRWRVLVPFSEPLPPASRAPMVARLNGLFNGALGIESFTLSQSYYFGSIKRNPDHRAVVTDGDFIDHRDDLDAGAIFKTNNDEQQASGVAGSRNPFTDYANRDNQWRALNNAALANLPAWVPQLFRGAKVRKGKGYRISSEMLGRNLQEDISITPDGIKDFGIHDIGDERQGRRTPIDLVIEHGGKTFDEATEWLRQRLGISSAAYASAADIVDVSYQRPRPTIKVPLNDAPKMPVMNLLNKVLGASTADKPPTRGLNGTMTRVAKMRIPNTHAFSSDDANAEHPEDDKDKLPAPDQYLLLTMNELETAELIEQHIDFVDIKGRSVCLPISFVKHYRTRFDEKLPTVAAIALAPIVLASGELLAPKGLDRTRGTVFEIPDEVRAIMPRPVDCSGAAVVEAMRFLCDEWLCDVLTDYQGKCIIIAAALTMIERSLLPDRPAFWVTAGRRGGGKTTTLSMLISAITGNLPAASAWSTNEEERRKAIMAQFMFGAPYILWDNITRGSQINCPHIEKSCTSAFYSDRKLGVSEIVTTSASTIHFFTGNNVGPRGDLASRSLKVEINVDRPDPENRLFQHADPIGWTENHRARLLRAFYTILIGNPQLKTKRNAPSKTRFKLWWRLVGAAVEHAARLHGAATPIDFEIIFRSQEDTEDEESLTLAEVLNAMLQRWPKGFVASDVAGVINDARSFNTSTSADLVFSGMLQGFLYPTIQHDRYVSPRSVGKQLGKHRNNPVRYDQQQVLTLRSRSDHSVVKGSLQYFIEVKVG
jgi:hypothetical protein